MTHLDQAEASTLDGTTVYDGQYEGEIALLNGEDRDLLFTEQDRRNANAALQARAVDNTLIDRLNALHERGKSVQALYYLSQYAVFGLVEGHFRDKTDS